MVQGNSFEAGPASSTRSQRRAITLKSLTPIKHTLFPNSFNRQDKQQPICMKTLACTHEASCSPAHMRLVWIWKAYRSIIGLSPHWLQPNDRAWMISLQQMESSERNQIKRSLCLTGLDGVLYWPVQRKQIYKHTSHFLVIFTLCVSYPEGDLCTGTLTKNNLYSLD